MSGIYLIQPLLGFGNVVDYEAKGFTGIVGAMAAGLDLLLDSALANGATIGAPGDLDACAGASGAVHVIGFDFHAVLFIE